MNVCICVTKLNYGMGGVSSHIIDLCKQYSKMHEINKVIVCADGGERVGEIENITKVQYYYCSFWDSGMTIQGVMQVYRELKKIVCNELVDIIHVHSQRILPVAHLLKRRFGIPYLWTNHIDAIPQKHVFKWMCKLMKFPIISVSDELRNMMIEKFKCNAKKVVTVNNGVDLEKLEPLNRDEKRLLEEKYEINRETTPYVISLLSRISPVKGHNVLLQAIAKSKYKNKIKLIIAGHTYPDAEEYLNSLVGMAKENEIDAVFLDFSKPRDVFGISELFVLPSVCEGFALVCIEALAMGCAVIRSRTPGWSVMKDWVEVVEKHDVDGLKRMIDLVIENGFNHEKTCEGKKKVWQFFSKEQCAKNTLQVYARIISELK